MLRLSQNEVLNASEWNDKFSNESSNNDYTVIGGSWITHIIDLHFCAVVLLLSWGDNNIHYLLLKLCNSIPFPESISPVLSPLPSIILFFLFPELLLFLFLTSVKLLNNRLLVRNSSVPHGLTKEVIKVFLQIVVHLHVWLNLIVHLRQECWSNGKISWSSEGAKVHHSQKSISFESWEEVFSKLPGN